MDAARRCSNDSGTETMREKDKEDLLRRFHDWYRETRRHKGERLDRRDLEQACAELGIDDRDELDALLQTAIEQTRRERQADKLTMDILEAFIQEQREKERRAKEMTKAYTSRQSSGFWTLFSR